MIRGADRMGNAALHRIVLVRMSRRHRPTMDYIARRTAEGPSKHDTIRCLKRYVARGVNHAAHSPRSDHRPPHPSRPKGHPRHPDDAVAEHFHRPINAIARLERGQVHNAELATR